MDKRCYASQLLDGVDQRCTQDTEKENADPYRESGSNTANIKCGIGDKMVVMVPFASEVVECCLSTSVCR